MRCHYCDRPATLAPEHEGVRVGLCDDCFEERLDELAESELLDGLLDELDLDGF